MKILSILFLCSHILFSQVVIVTNKNSDIDSLSQEYIQYLYLAKTTKVDNIKIKPLLSKEKVLHKLFINNILNKTTSQYNSYWARLVFTGRKSISKKLDHNEIIKSLDNLNTIAYVKKNKLQENWKIIYEKD
jgi:hypothetical protein